MIGYLVIQVRDDYGAMAVETPKIEQIKLNIAEHRRAIAIVGKKITRSSEIM